MTAAATLLVAGCGASGPSFTASGPVTSMPGFSSAPATALVTDDQLYHLKSARWREGDGTAAFATSVAATLKRQGYFFNSLDTERFPTRIKALAGPLYTPDGSASVPQSIPQHSWYRFSNGSKERCVYVRDFFGRTGGYEASSGGALLGTQRIETVYCVSGDRTIDESLVSEIRASTSPQFWRGIQ